MLDKNDAPLICPMTLPNLFFTFHGVTSYSKRLGENNPIIGQN